MNECMRIFKTQKQVSDRWIPKFIQLFFVPRYIGGKRNSWRSVQ